MFSWMSKDEERKKNANVYSSVAAGLQNVYKSKLLPLEKVRIQQNRLYPRNQNLKIPLSIQHQYFLSQEYQFHDFHSPALDDPDFDARPMVMLVGQYSTGKTTFIRYLLEQDFPGIRIGPEPTTDRFAFFDKLLILKM